jgi:hypothetical protein
MNTLTSTLATAALMCTSTVAFAQEQSKPASNHHQEHQCGMMGSQMKSMDANGDGLITKIEFMNAHEAKWNDLPKNSDGAILIADMEKAHQAHMDSQHAQKHDAMMQNHQKMMNEHEEMMDADEKDGPMKEMPTH